MNQIAKLRRAFAGTTGPAPNILNLASALNAWYLRWPEHNFLHPCAIGGRPALVCQRELSIEAPEAFRTLQELAEQFGVFLKEDSRQQQLTTAWQNRRHNAGLVLTFCIGLLAASRAVSAAELPHNPTRVAAAAQLLDPRDDGHAAITNGSHPVIKLRHVKPPSALEVLAAYNNPRPADSIDQAAQTVIQEFLAAAYQADPGDPGFINTDLDDMAKYFADYPQVIALIYELRAQNVILQYRKDTWQTQAWGTKSRVDNVTIYFDTRLGAQLIDGPGCEANPACAIAPADALLHELLHAKLMLLDTEHFIAEGGMGVGLYLFEHEREVISKENQLYQAMNQHDGRYRPIRHNHGGKLLTVACPACTPSQQIVSSDTNR